ncbi:hypothetical protein CRE_24183 [Caenorhabditis remanei]|uniref:Uncharacterized protein n=1 Tax=Caenorhabditis remanei TaxID=31234 RepID=E3N984_CAERE|nr:hypothetical protein CRE_24183 [Caenorhabditis remanei]
MLAFFFFFVGFGAALDVGGVLNRVSTQLNSLTPNSDILTEIKANVNPETELSEKFKEQLNDLLEKIKDAVDNGKELKEEILVKLKEALKQLKDMKVDIGNKARELIEEIKGKLGSESLN